MLACVLTAPAGARAQATPTESHVLAIEGDDILIDFGRPNGARDGAVVELWRPVTLKHPVTGAMLSDRFLIGRLRIRQAREQLSLARAEGRLARRAQPGDVIVSSAAPAPVKAVAAAKPATATEPASEPAAAPQDAPPDPRRGASPQAAVAGAASPSDVEAQEVSQLFDALRGSDTTTRILAYEARVRERQNGRYARVLWEEAQLLRRLLKLERLRKNEDEPGAAKPRTRSFRAPEETLERTPLALGIELDDATGALVHYRAQKDVAYRTKPMERRGPGYFVAGIEAESIKAPVLEYFIEATTPEGTVTSVEASAASPHSLRVVRLPKPDAKREFEALALISTDYADWNNLKGNDRVWQTEGMVGLRLRDVGIRAVHTGFGVYRGVGGSLHELDELGREGRRVGLTYGYLEGEFGASHFVGLLARAIVGLENYGISGGAQFLVRLGNDRETNLLLGGELLGTIGVRGITQLELQTFERVPIVLRTEVTNQPAGSNVSSDPPADEDATEQGEVGARIIAQVGYRVTPGLTLSLRGSYQGRTIHHAGPGFGGAVSYQW